MIKIRGSFIDLFSAESNRKCNIQSHIFLQSPGDLHVFLWLACAAGTIPNGKPKINLPPIVSVPMVTWTASQERRAVTGANFLLEKMNEEVKGQQHFNDLTGRNS